MVSKNRELIRLSVILRSGESITLHGARADAEEFHSRFMKWVDGRSARTDNYKLLFFGGAVIVASELAYYSAENTNGETIQFKVKNT